MSSRRRPVRALLLAVLSLLVGASVLAPTAAAGEPVRLVVRMADRGTDIAALAGARQVDAIEELGIAVLEVPAHQLDDVTARLEASPAVASVEVDQVVRPAAYVGDPEWANQWGPQKLRVPQAWDTTSGDPSVVIAVVDSGVSASHPDLAGAVLPGIDLAAGDDDASDVYGHGTLVAGIAAARANNGIDTAGYCWGCSILPVRVLGDSGTGRATWTAKGIVWAADNGADVINLSVTTMEVDNVVSDAVDYARAKGAVVVAAAGNGGTSDPTIPASLDGVIGVAGINSDDAMYSWSNHGSWVDVAAPSCHAGLTLPTGSRQFCGTSSSTPAVAGVAALLFAARPGIPGAEVERIIRDTAVPVGSWVADGRVDAAAAVAAATAWIGPPEAPTAVTAVPGPGRADVSWAAPAGDGGSPLTGYTVTAEPGGASVTVDAGATTATLTGLANGTAHTFSVVATNAAGSSAPSSPSAAVVPADVPAAPAVTVDAGSASAVVRWATADDGGSPVTSHTVTVTPGDLVLDVPAPATSTTIDLEPGTTYEVAVSAVNAVGPGPASTPVSVTAAAPEAVRLGGASRVETAVAVSTHAYDGAATVVIARADAYADALAAGPLAAAHDAPVLLSPTAGLPADVAAEVVRLGATQAILVGGTSALAPAVEDGLRAAGVTSLRRIAGQNRFDTARLIAGEVGGTSVVLVEGAHRDPSRGWPDAVAASAYAAAAGRPILLVAGAAVPAETAAALVELAASHITIVGGTAAVPDGLVAGLGIPFTRLAGSDRYATSVAVADAATALGADASRAWVATGRTWPDALAAGPAAARAGAVLLLVDGADAAGSAVVTEWLADNGGGSRELVVVGGAGSVAGAVEDLLEAQAQ